MTKSVSDRKNLPKTKLAKQRLKLTFHRVPKTGLVSEFGKANVDYQIQRIADRGYKGCCNSEQRTDYDFEQLEIVLLGK